MSQTECSIRVDRLGLSLWSRSGWALCCYFTFWQQLESPARAAVWGSLYQCCNADWAQDWAEATVVTKIPVSLFSVPIRLDLIKTKPLSLINTHGCGLINVSFSPQSGFSCFQTGEKKGIQFFKYYWNIFSLHVFSFLSEWIECEWTPSLSWHHWLNQCPAYWSKPVLSIQSIQSMPAIVWQLLMPDLFKGLIRSGLVLTAMPLQHSNDRDDVEAKELLVQIPSPHGQ